MSENKTLERGPSLIASMYGAWEQYKIPAIFYHYLLAVLPIKQKKEQIVLMSKEIKLLKSNNHPYHIIINALQARQRSLEAIRKLIPQLVSSDAKALQWSAQRPQIDEQGDLIFESRPAERQDNRTLVELINHIRLYQKLTYQVISSIDEWEQELFRLGYNAPIQFLYRHEDYLQKITKDTDDLTQKYEELFQKNPFLIFRREHQHSQYALVYHNLKFSSQFAKKIQEALEIISNHDTMIERNRILGKFNRIGTKKQIIKSESLHKIYCDYNRGRDYYLIKDSSLKADSLILNLKNKIEGKEVLINPEIFPKNYQQKRHPVFLRKNLSEVTARRQSLPISHSEAQLKKFNHKTNIMIDEMLDSQRNRGKLLQKKLSLYDNLDKTIKYKKQKVTTPKVQTQKQILLETPFLVQQNPIKQETPIFIYEWALSPYQLLKYLRDDIYSGKDIGLRETQLMAKKILAEKDLITLVRVKIGQFLAAWLGIRFLSKDLTLRRAVDIILITKFIKIPDFQNLLVSQFLKHGYGVIRQKGVLVHEVDMLERLGTMGVKVKYKIAQKAQRQEIKDIMKKNVHLKQSRILKYYSYSRGTKYHKYCQHSDTHCQLAFLFEQMWKVSISGKTYIKAKPDSLVKEGQCFRLMHHLNEYDMLIANEYDQLPHYFRDQIQINSSYQIQKCPYQFVCFPETKLMHKYVGQNDQPILAEYLTINTDIPQIISLTPEKQSTNEWLILQPPFYIAFVCNKHPDQGKTLGILHFD